MLRELPEWFGIEEALLDYVEKVKSMLFFAAYDKDDAVGFVALEKHNEYTQEIYVMGIKEGYHRQKIGTQLIDTCIDVCERDKAKFLTVKTLDESFENEYYDKTRKFYLAMGFIPLEVFPLLWGPESPCLYMAKSLN